MSLPPGPARSASPTDPHLRPGDFWQAVDQLVAGSPLVIDRPRGSVHPRYPELVYPLDYGYLEGTRAMDGGGIDVWLGSLPERACEAVAVTLDLFKRDSEVKLLLGCTPVEEQTILDFLNQGAMRAHLVRRENDLLALMRTRRSVRRFQPRPVPAELVEQALAAAGWAPSAHHRQPWRFAVLSSLSSRQQFAQALGQAFAQDLRADDQTPEEVAAAVQRSYERLTQAPVAILLCLDISAGDRYPDAERQDAERLMGVQGVAMAGENLLLAAHALGLGGVWVCAPLFAPQAARAALGLPAEWQAQGIVLLGYPAKDPAPRPRRATVEITRYY